MEETKKALILMNPRAGRGEPELAESILTKALQQYHWQVQCQIISKGTSPQELLPILNQAVEQGTKLVIAAGGDGTVSLVASAIILSGQNQRLRLGVFPGGTANSIARELGMPADWAQAAQLIASIDQAMNMDAMKMNDRFYFLRIGIGLDAEVIRDTTRKAKRWLGRFAYLQTFLGRLFTFHRHRYYCVMDGKKRRFRAVQVFIANGGQIALAPFPIGPGIAFNDGILNVCAYDVVSWWHYFVVAWRLLWRDYQHQPQMKYWAIRQSITVASRHPRIVQGDGEACASTPVTIEVIPSALQVINTATQR